MFTVDDLVVLIEESLWSEVLRILPELRVLVSTEDIRYHLGKMITMKRIRLGSIDLIITVSVDLTDLLPCVRSKFDISIQSALKTKMNFIYTNYVYMHAIQGRRSWGELGE